MIFLDHVNLSKKVFSSSNLRFIIRISVYKIVDVFNSHLDRSIQQISECNSI